MTGFSGTPLRVRLVATLLALMALALVLTGVTATRSLRGYLVERLDDQLVSARKAIMDRGEAGRPGRPERPRGNLEFLNTYFVQVNDLQGQPIGSFVPERGARPALPPLTAGEVARRAGRPFTVGSVTGDRRWRVLASPSGDGPSSLVIGLPTGDVDETVSRLVLIELVVGAVVLAALGGVGYALVRSSLRPLTEVETTAAAIAGGDLSRRVPERDARTEVGRLGLAFNAMIGQIEDAFRARTDSERAARESERRMRRFVADASHELRTPLTSIRGFAELYRQGAAGDVSKLMRRIEDEGARMGLLVDDLLLLARLDQQRALDRRPVDLLPLAADAVHDAQVVAPGRAIELQATGRHPVVLGDEPRLRQVIANLVSNALVHTPDGTPVEVVVGGDDRTVVLEVVDHGPGMGPEDAERVFERFFRADPSRTREHGGSGLGLSIVAALVAAHEGTVSVETVPGEGATFRVVLPRAAGELPAASDEADSFLPA